MAREFEVKTRLTAVDDASSTIGRVEKAFGGLADTIKDRFVITAGDAERALRVFVDLLASSISAAAAQETAVAQLSAALANLAPGAERGAKALLEQADALQKVTKFGDDAVISAQALLATFGVAPDKIGAATQAAVNLAAALGTDLSSAASQVGATFNGVTRGLEKVVPGLRGLSDEALKAGAAVDVMNDALGNRAVAAADTFEGRITILSNALGEVKETIGGVVVTSDELNGALVAAAVATNAWNTALKTTIPIIKELAIEQSSVLSTARDLARLFELVADSFREAENPAGELGITMDSLGQSMANMTALQERNIRVNGEYAASFGEAEILAKKLGLTLSSQLKAAQDQEAADLARLNELLRINGDSIATNTDKLNGNAAAARNAAQAYDDLARAMIPVNQGGLTLSQQITFAGSGSVVSGSQGAPINGGTFGGGSSINAQSRLPPIVRR